MNRHQLKIKRLEKAYHQLLSQAIRFEVDDPRLTTQNVTISRVTINKECTKATVFFLLEYEGEEINKSQRNKVIKGLYHSAPFLLSFIGERLRVGTLPGLSFFYDARTEKADKVLNLIDRLARKESEGL